MPSQIAALEPALALPGRRLAASRSPSLASGADKGDLSAMNVGLSAAPVVFAVMLAGCAGGMSTSECASADWSALGLADGRSGAAPKLVEQRREACAAGGHEADLAAYDAARAEGLAAYCTSKGGFEAGKAGGEYFGVCPKEAEIEFLESFALGGELRELTAATEKAVEDYEKAVAELDQHIYLLRVAEKRYVKPSITNEDRELERQDAEFRRREIARIESRLPGMLDQIEVTRKAVQTYRIELLTKGLEL